jgi:hypothetical protein
LALDFNSYTAEARQKELNLIENHLRVCVQASNYFDRVRSMSPSEPPSWRSGKKDHARIRFQTCQCPFDRVPSTRHRTRSARRSYHDAHGHPCI